MFYKYNTYEKTYVLEQGSEVIHVHHRQKAHKKVNVDRYSILGEFNCVVFSIVFFDSMGA